MNRTGLIIGLVVAIVGVLALVLGLYYGTMPSDDPEPRTPGQQQYERIDCYPEAMWGNEAVTQEKCEERGCRFEPFPSSGLAVPACFVSPDSPLGQGYSSGDTVDDSYGYTLSLSPKAAVLQTRTGDQTQSQLLSGLIENVAFQVEFRSNDILHFKVSVECHDILHFKVSDFTVFYILTLVKPHFTFQGTRWHDILHFKVRRLVV